MSLSSCTGRRWPYIVLALIALGGLGFGFLGMAMAGSFSVATAWPPPPGYVEHWQHVAYAYFALFLVSLLALLVACAVLWRRRGRAGRTAHVAS